MNEVKKLLIVASGMGSTIEEATRALEFFSRAFKKSESLLDFYGQAYHEKPRWVHLSLYARKKRTRNKWGNKLYNYAIKLRRRTVNE